MNKRRITSTASGIARWVLAVAILLAIWQYLLLGHISPAFFASPRATFSQIAAWNSGGKIWSMVGVTLEEALIGLVIGSLIGLVIGLTVGAGPVVLSRLLEPVVSGLYAMPKLILAPLLYVALGTGLTPKVFIVVLAVFPVVAMYTATGVRTADPDMVRSLRMFGANSRQVAVKALLPHTSGYIVSAMLFAGVHAITVAIGAEILFGASTGIGGVLATETGSFIPKGVLGTLVIGTVLSVLVLQIVRWASARFEKSGYGANSTGGPRAGGAGAGV